ncbi:MAG: alpha-1,2-fucosyltransferase [Thiobacillus sp.]|nr:alpha-1,2-fucosyltransferase [Thiobacillus sp.]
MASPCVIARLAGGLGNQLFMYAFAKALAVRNDVPLLLDTHSGFVRDRNYRRTFLLDHLIPPTPHASRWQARAWPLVGRALQSWDRRRNARLPLAERDYLRERSPDFDAEIYHLRVTRPLIVDGYWQSPRYFDDLPLRDLIRFPDALTRAVTAEDDSIRASATPVCLAVRRYEEIPRHKRPMLILDADYFYRAMAWIETHVESPHYFVFAQDMPWARDNLHSQHPITFASPKDADTGAIQDLYLMSRCRHFILSNSTLHWWGAWLGASDGACVVAPAAGWVGRDTLPTDWHTL